MSIVDDRMHVVEDQPRHERLWQTADTAPILSSSADATTGGARPGAAGCRIGGARQDRRRVRGLPEPFVAWLIFYDVHAVVDDGHRPPGSEAAAPCQAAFVGSTLTRPAYRILYPAST